MLRRELTSPYGQSPANTHGAAGEDEASPRAVQHTCPWGAVAPAAVVLP